MPIRDYEIVLREKQGADDDPSYSTLLIDPNTAIISVGTAGAGTWSLAIEPVSESDTAPNPVSFLREGSETADEIATAWAAAINAALEDGQSRLALYVRQASAVDDAVRLAVRRNAPRHLLAVSSPGDTATVSPEDARWPIAQYVPMRWGDGRTTKVVYVTALPIDGDGNVVPIDSTPTYSMRPIDGIEVGGEINSAFGDLVEGVAVGAARDCPYSGGLFGIEVSDVADLPTDCVALRFILRPSDV